MVLIDNEEYLTGSEAAAYLAKRWEMESYSTVAFRMLRHHRKITPDVSLNATSLWKKSTLDTIAKPDRTRPRPRLLATTQEAA